MWGGGGSTCSEGLMVPLAPLVGGGGRVWLP